MMRRMSKLQVDIVFGKDKFEELLNDEKIEFQRLCEFEVNNPKDTEIEEYKLYEEDYLSISCNMIAELLRKIDLVAQFYVETNWSISV